MEVQASPMPSLNRLQAGSPGLSPQGSDRSALLRLGAEPGDAELVWPLLRGMGFDLSSTERLRARVLAAGPDEIMQQVPSSASVRDRLAMHRILQLIFSPSVDDSLRKPMDSCTWSGQACTLQGASSPERPRDETCIRSLGLPGDARSVWLSYGADPSDVGVALPLLVAMGFDAACVERFHECLLSVGQEEVMKLVPSMAPVRARLALSRIIQLILGIMKQVDLA